VGLNTKAREALIALEPQEIIYISCDLGTLALDLKHFREVGYSLQTLNAFDMFTLTAHMATMDVLHDLPMLTQ
jgi:23S rRNA (uracil1939-C5)-methyltransferase